MALSRQYLLPLLSSSAFLCSLWVAQVPAQAQTDSEPAIQTTAANLSSSVAAAESADAEQAAEPMSAEPAIEQPAADETAAEPAANPELLAADAS
ncbi:MAG TPA: hypothetical protein V6D06_01835, partial [Trichocoleus sp.]